MPPPPPTTAIIGAGFSGTLTAIHLARLCVGGPPHHHADRPRIVLLDRTGAFGPGLAYSTDSPVHFLNVPAGNMSAFDDDPAHFLRWAQAHQSRAESAGNPIGSGSFLPRAVYGRYLREILEHARAHAPNLIDLRAQAATAIRVQQAGRILISTSSGSPILADRVVLALGNFLPPHPPASDSDLAQLPGYIHNPWNTGAIASILPDEPVLIVGTGLTMMDVVMQLHTQQHDGRIHAISRHGLLPRPHRSPSRAPSHREPPAALRTWNGSARGLIRIVRRAVRDQAHKGIDWRDVVTSLRPVTAHLWQTMPAPERERFLSRLRSYWEVVRHRAAPEAAACISDLIAARQLIVRAGRLVSFQPAPGNGKLIEATFRPRGSMNPQTLRVARVINCMGPQTDVTKIDDPLLKQLLAEGLITPDPFGSGIQVADDGAAIGADGQPSTAIYIIGPFRKAQSWENTAVPELKKQAAQVAEAVAAAPVRAAR